jgi:hypothetical protein
LFHFPQEQKIIDKKNNKRLKKQEKILKRLARETNRVSQTKKKIQEALMKNSAA